MPEITVIVGDITRQPDCEAIVNAANPYLIAGGGVCGAIYRAAGKELEPVSKKLAPLATGEAVITPAFNLPNKFIIHTVGPKYLLDPEPAQSLANCIFNSLRLAQDHGVKRIAFPALSTGIYGYPLEEAAKVMIDAARSVQSDLEKILFVVVSQQIRDAFSL